MMITMTSAISGRSHTRDIPGITQAEIDAWKASDLLIQHVFPHLSDDDREFIMTGITPEEWDASFCDHGDDPNDFDADEDHRPDPDDEPAF